MKKYFMLLGALLLHEVHKTPVEPVLGGAAAFRQLQSCSSTLGLSG